MNEQEFKEWCAKPCEFCGDTTGYSFCCLAWMQSFIEKFEEVRR
jgi:hypothetical protein